MANHTKIEWAHSTFNPWIGCTKVSPACDHCYAEVSAPSRTRGIKWGVGTPRLRTNADYWRLPLRWNEEPFYMCDCGYSGTMHEMTTNAVHVCGLRFQSVRRRVFCASLSDVFDNEINRDWRDDLATLILDTPNLDWLLLTKRVGNAGRMLGEMFLDGTPPNIWLGSTICNQAEADRDIPKLLAVPAAVRFLSVEPMLGAVDLTRVCDRSGVRGLWINSIEAREANPAHAELVASLGPAYPHSRIDWVIAGGESGSYARPSHPDWFRSLRDQCAAAGVPFLFKQWGEWAPANGIEWMKNGGSRLDLYVAEFGEMARVGKKAAGRLLDGVQHDGYPLTASS
ncbi:MAG: phage Gp37/Gp68 family protein [Lysobacteraceae bacterium]